MIQKPAGGGKSAPTRKTVRLMVKKPMDSLLIIFSLLPRFSKMEILSAPVLETIGRRHRSKGSLRAAPRSRFWIAAWMQFLDCCLDYDVT